MRRWTSVCKYVVILRRCSQRCRHLLVEILEWQNNGAAAVCGVDSEWDTSMMLFPKVATPYSSHCCSLRELTMSLMIEVCDTRHWDIMLRSSFPELLAAVHVFTYTLLKWLNNGATAGFVVGPHRGILMVLFSKVATAWGFGRRVLDNVANGWGMRYMILWIERILYVRNGLM